MFGSRAIWATVHDLPEQARGALHFGWRHSQRNISDLEFLQGLARCGLLDKFHYLSTVSGGGYIGSWLIAWIQPWG